MKSGSTQNGTANKSGWRKVRFDEMAENIGDRVDNPAEAGVERYVGLEHLDPESLKIRRWGTPDEVEATKLRFQPGDIIFGKRRAYQRKLAVADFEGICSAHAMVLRAREETVLKDFLPVFMQSEVFFERALSISVGSLSPTINWKTLAAQEFVIPPKDEQRRIAEILWAADSTEQEWIKARQALLQLKKAACNDLWHSGIGHTDFKVSPLGRIPKAWRIELLKEHTASSAYGPRFPGEDYSADGNVQTVRTTDFDRRGGLTLATAPAAVLPESVIKLHQLKPGDFLISRSGEYAGLTAAFDATEGWYVPAAFVIRLRLKESLLSHFLVYLCQCDFGEKYVASLATGSAQPNISGSALLELPVPVPPVDEQHKIVAEWRRFLNEADSIDQHFGKTVALKSGLLNQLCGNGLLV